MVIKYKENVPHGVTFINSQGISKHTWKDWRIVPTSRPLFLPPSVKTVLMSIPGSDGVLDLTESLTGEVHFENRKGSMEFSVENKDRWFELYSDIMDYLHGGKIVSSATPVYYFIDDSSTLYLKDIVIESQNDVDVNITFNSI